LGIAYLHVITVGAALKSAATTHSSTAQRLPHSH
jgi:hypothetical protein